MTGTTGLVLAGRYRLLDQVAVGAMGEVWRAHDDRLDRDVAVKVLRPELADDADFLHRFRDEARHAASVRHPNVAAVHDYGEDESRTPGGTAVAYLVMDLLDGPDLGVVLHETGPLPERRVAMLLTQVADALAAAHSTGLVHRDVKPANLVVSLDRPDAVTVTDFGIARAADAVPVTRTGLVMGTAEYLSPEQARGQRATAASDVYSLGAVAYELLAGRPPFTGDGAAEVARAHVQEPVPPLPETVDGAMRATVLRCLAKRPEDRPDAGELAARLRALVEGTASADGAWTRPDPSGPAAAGSGTDAAGVGVQESRGAAGGAGGAAGPGGAPDRSPGAAAARSSVPAVAPTREIPVVGDGHRTGDVGPARGRGAEAGRVSSHTRPGTATSGTGPGPDRNTETGLVPHAGSDDSPAGVPPTGSDGPPAGSDASARARPPAGAARVTPRRPRRAPLRAPLVALLALVALLLLATGLQQAGLLGARTGDIGTDGGSQAHVTGSPWPTTHDEDGR